MDLYQWHTRTMKWTRMKFLRVMFKAVPTGLCIDIAREVELITKDQNVRMGNVAKFLTQSDTCFTVFTRNSCAMEMHVKLRLQHFLDSTFC